MVKRRVVLMVLVAVSAAEAAPAAVLRVEQDGSGEYLKIQDAVDAAASGDTILIGPGRYDDLQPRGVNNVVCVAFWDKGGALTFIGESADDVIIGPETYAPDGTGPQGIHQRAPADIFVRNLTFTNLLSAIVGGDALMRVDDSRFYNGSEGIFVQDPDSCIVQNCLFSTFPAAQHANGYAIAIFRAGYAAISGCQFTDAMVYFGSTPNGVLRDCVVTSGPFAGYASSGGLVEGCLAEGRIWVYSRDLLRIVDNTFTGGTYNIRVYGQETQFVMERNSISSPAATANLRIGDETGSFVAHDNDIRAGTEYAVLVYNLGVPGSVRHFDMSNNYWFENSNSAALDSLIYDANDDPSVLTIMDYEPIRSSSVPAQAKSFGGIKSLYR